MRIVSLLPAATDIVVRLGLGESLVGRSHLCGSGASGNVLTVPAVQPAWPALSAYEVDWEAVGALRPDLILTRAAPGHARASDAIVPLAGPGPARMLGLEALTIDGILASMLALSVELGVAEAGRTEVDFLRRRIEGVANRAAAARHKPVVVALDDLDGPSAAPGWVPEQILLAGGTPALAEPGSPSAPASWEDVANAQPELFLALPQDCDVLESLRRLESLGARDELRWLWREIPATYLSQIYALEALRFFSGPGPGVFDGIEVLAGLLHPDTFPAPLAAHALRP